MKNLIAGIALVVLLFLILPLAFTERGDWLGPAERTARALLSGWDMWSTASVRPYETPMPLRPAGTVSTRGRPGYGPAVAALADFESGGRAERGALVYQRFCRHCHGINGDGRTIVGESFDVRLPDLRHEDTQRRSDEDLFNTVFDGTEKMIPLRHTVPPEDLLLAIQHVRTLKNAPSVPYYQPPQPAGADRDDLP